MSRVLLAGALLLAASEARAGRDYDPESAEWNGLARLGDLAREGGLTLRVPGTLDWDALSPETGVLLVYPTTSPSRAGLVAHLRRGGRALLADDFGASDELLRALGVERVEEAVSGGLRFRPHRDLPVAAPVDPDHVLARGVRRVVSNHPASLRSELPAVFVAGEPPRTLVAVGAVGQGRLVLLSDPSVLINNMLELRGNEQFARNLLAYLAADGARTLLLVSGRFAQRSGGESVAGVASAARLELNGLMARLSDVLAPGGPDRRTPLWLLLVSSLLCAVATGLVVVRLGPRPRLYRGQWLRPRERQRAAGFVGTLEYLGASNASHVYPLLILKRELEARLLDGLGLPAPQKLGTVLEAFARREPSRRRRKQLERLLLRLGGLSSAATSGASVPVTRRELQRTLDLARTLLRSVGRDIEGRP